MPQLLGGKHPALAALREQYGLAAVGQVEFTGRGFLVEFVVPRGTALASPPDFAGGYAPMRPTGAGLGAGCLLYVRDGRLSALEGFTYDDEWPPDAHVEIVGYVKPIEPNITLHERGTHGRTVELVWNEYPRTEGGIWGSRVLREVVHRLMPRCLVINLGDLDGVYGMPLVSSLVTGAAAMKDLGTGRKTRIVATGEMGTMLERHCGLADVGPCLDLAVCPDIASALADCGLEDEAIL